MLWGISQNAHTKGLGFDGGTRSIFIPVFLLSADNLSASEGILRATMIPSDKKLSTTQIQSLCDKSPVSRAIFYGGLNEWFPMPKLPNYSGFDRESRQFIHESTAIEEDNLSVDFAETSPKLTKISQTERMMQMLAATSEHSISEFIKKELKVNTPEQEKQLISGIVEMLNEQGKLELIKKFSLDM